MEGVWGRQPPRKNTPKYNIFVRETVIYKAETVQNHVSKRSKISEIFQNNHGFVTCRLFFSHPETFFFAEKKKSAPKKKVPLCLPLVWHRVTDGVEDQ